MAATDREVTKEELETLAAKLGPAVESLSAGEREIFELILERAGGAGDEVSGFVLIKQISEVSGLKAGGGSAVWGSPLAGGLAAAAGMMAAPKKFDTGK